ncbi:MULTISPECIES: isochorismatase family protein [Pseudoalteromonas]|uniref:isochorismatase family protein n=4 Tax=Pseudoalteromonas TaxID=53246 RepID=UPI0007322970|nr:MULTISPECIES: isochorismatase family protein [Pseudoalteromonas]KTF16359.1 hydrolase [Pseudoalteromonas sp. 10-33]MDC2856787.1 isochorismatase family protein [Ningiella sp. W23]|tara:strand:- start:1026 stop:1649 length:624 start_codon:yes stop_codon:yes gene_type:complete
MNKFTEMLTIDNAVLAMIDHQTGLLVSCRDQDPHLMTQNIKGLCSLAKTVGMPSIITASMPDGPNGPIMTEITDILGDDIIERAGEINAWKSPEFKQAIKATGRKKIIMAGIVTDVCLLFPAISAVAEGYDVYAVVDASGTWNKAVTDAAMHRMTQAGVKVVTWASVLAEVMDDWRSEHGIALGGVLGEHTSYRWVYNSFLQASGQN